MVYNSLYNAIITKIIRKYTTSECYRKYSKMVKNTVFWGFPPYQRLICVPKRAFFRLGGRPSAQTPPGGVPPPGGVFYPPRGGSPGGGPQDPPGG